MRAESLRRGLLKRMALLLIGFTLAEAAALYYFTRVFSNEAYDEWLLDSAHAIAQLVHVSERGVVVDLPEATLHAMLWDAHDQVIYRVEGQQEGLLAGHAELSLVPDWDVATARYRDLLIAGQPMRAVQIMRDDLGNGHAVMVTVAETTHKRERLSQRVLATTMALSFLVGLMLILFARGAIARGLRPLVVLASTIRQRPQGDLTRLPDNSAVKELAIFTEAINDLLTQLEEAFHVQRRFVADAAHQLRTPLTALKLELEHAAREPDQDKHQRALSDMRSSIDRLTRLTNQLLTLARSEPGALSHVGFHVLDLAQLVQQTAGRFLPRALSQDVDLGFEGETAVWVQGDALLLEEVVNNLLDNALRYAGPAACVTVQVDACDGRALLAVEDNGPGVPEASLPRLTERFRRLPGSLAGGSGLGLAIVQEIILRHDGTLAFESVQPHGLRVQVSLPLCDAPSTAPAG